MLLPAPASGQVEINNDPLGGTSKLTLLEEMIEKSAESADEEADPSALTEELIELTGKPVDLNSAEEEDLDAIPGLSPAQRNELYLYLITYGEVLSIFELQAVPGFTPALIMRLQPFIKIVPPSPTPSLSFRNLAKYGHHDLLIRFKQAFPESTGYVSSDSTTGSADLSAPYQGTSQRYYFRYTYNWFDKIKIGIAGEKDPGEQFFRGAQSNGMDFYAGYLSLINIGPLKNFTVGNFKVFHGQGLTIGSGLAMGSAPGYSVNLNPASGIRPGLGMNEAAFLRGITATVKIKRTVISSFISYHPLDGTVNGPAGDSTGDYTVSSIGGTGYHRTTSELAKRNSLKELVCGGNINVTLSPSQQLGFKIGLTGLFYRYSIRILPKSQPYNQFDFSGTQNYNTGFDFQARYKGTFFFGEISRSGNNGMAWIAGLTLAPDQRATLTMICRDYKTNYQNPFSGAFGQNSMNAGERGIYASINAGIHPKASLSAYVDLFTFPWLKYRVEAPSRGQEYGILVDWHLSGRVKAQLKFYQKNTRGNTPAETGQPVHKLGNFVVRSYRSGIEWSPLDGVLLKSRVEVKEAAPPGRNTGKGYLLLQDFNLRTFRWPETITFRYALFDIIDYDCRIYVYEPEVLYAFSVPAYYGKGMRACLVLKFGITKSVDLWLRGGITCYTDRQTVGSGPDLTQGNYRAEVTGQLLIKL